MDFAKLNELNSMTKKSDASQAKKNEFQNELFTLLVETGYDAIVEKYMFEGVSLGGVNAIYKYYITKSPEEKNQIMSAISTGALFVQNTKGAAFRVLVDLLMNTLNDSEKDLALLAFAIKNIPAKCKSKENKLWGDAGKTISKNLIFALILDTNLPAFEELNIKEAFIKEFKSIIAYTLSTIDTQEPWQTSAIEKFEKWIKPVERNIEVTMETAQMPSIKENKKAEVTPASAIKPLKRNELNDLSITLKSISDRLVATADQMQATDKGVNTLNAKLSVVQSEYEAEKCKTSDLIDKVGQAQEELKQAQSKNDSLSLEIFSLNDKLKIMEHEISRLNEVIERQESVLSVYSADKQNAQVEQLNIIASKLRPEYLDFKNAINMSMSLDLGENLRQQLLSIFKILSKCGVDIERR